MEKELYIELLNERINKISEELDKTNNLINDYNKENRRYKRINTLLLTIMLAQNFMSMTINNDALVKKFIPLVILEEFAIVAYNVTISERNNADINKLSEMISKYTCESNKIDNMIKFLDTTSEEEFNKYLSYKMN